MRWAMLGTAAVVLAADQITKSLVLRLHPVTGSGLVSVRLVRNTGASGGIAAGYPVLVTLAAVAIVALAATLAVRNSSLLGGGLAVLGALALAVLLGRSLTTPLVQMTKAVEGFGRNEAIAVPSNGSAEIRVLAGAFARMAAEARANTAALKTEIEERRRIFDASLDLILVVDCNGALVRVSPSTEKAHIEALAA